MDSKLVYVIAKPHSQLNCSAHFLDMIKEQINIRGGRAFIHLNRPNVPNKTDTIILAYTKYILKL